MVALGAVGLWLNLEPGPPRPASSPEVQAANRYQYQPDAGCTPQEVFNPPSAREREIQRRACANQAQDHRRELDDLTQQTRAADAVEEANRISQENLRLAYFQLAFALFGAYVLWRSLTATERALGIAHQSNEIAARNAFIEHRPWLYVEISGTISYGFDMSAADPGQHACKFTLPIRVKNAGMTPAIDIECFTVCGSIGEAHTALGRALKAIMPSDDPLGLGSVPPSSHHDFTEAVRCRMRRPPEGAEPVLSPWAVVVLRYRSATMPAEAAPLVTAQAFQLVPKTKRPFDNNIRVSELFSGQVDVLASPARSEMT